MCPPSLFSSCAASLSLSLLSCPSFTLVIKRLMPFLKQPSRPACRTPVLLANDLRIACVTSADIKTRKAIGPHCMRLALPLPTIPWSGLFKNWKGFRVVYRTSWLYCVHFRPYFVLDLSTLHFPVSPFDLEFVLDIRRDIPHCYVLEIPKFIFHLLTNTFPSRDQPPIHFDHMTNHLTTHMTSHLFYITCSQVTCTSPDIPYP